MKEAHDRENIEPGRAEGEGEAVESSTDEEGRLEEEGAEGEAESGTSANRARWAALARRT